MHQWLLGLHFEGRPEVQPRLNSHHIDMDTNVYSRAGERKYCPNVSCILHSQLFRAVRYTNMRHGSRTNPRGLYFTLCHRPRRTWAADPVREPMGGFAFHLVNKIPNNTHGVQTMIHGFRVKLIKLCCRAGPNRAVAHKAIAGFILRINSSNWGNSPTTVGHARSSET